MQVGVIDKRHRCLFGAFVILFVVVVLADSFLSYYFSPARSEDVDRVFVVVHLFVFLCACLTVFFVVAVRYRLISTTD